MDSEADLSRYHTFGCSQVCFEKQLYLYSYQPCGSINIRCKATSFKEKEGLFYEGMNRTPLGEKEAITTIG